MFIYHQLGLAPGKKWLLQKTMFMLKAYKFNVFQRPTKPYTATAIPGRVSPCKLEECTQAMFSNPGSRAT